MRISVFSFFVGVVHALLRDISVSDSNSILDNTKYIENDNTYLHAFPKQLLSSVAEDDGLFEFIKNYQATWQTKQNLESEIIEKLTSRSTFVEKRETSKGEIPKEDIYFLELLAGFLKKPITHSLCMVVLQKICSNINNYILLSGPEGNFISKKCENVNATCGSLINMMAKYCLYIKEVQDKITIITQELCTYYSSRCKNLKNACENSLQNSCATIETKCKNLKDDSKAQKGIFVNTHTQIIDVTVYVTEVVSHTHTSVVFTKKKCCSGKTRYKTCTSKTATCPTLSTVTEACPTVTSSKDSNQIPAETSSDEPIPTETSLEESKPTETSSEEPEPTEESEPTGEPTLTESTDDEECTITKTVTMTNRFGETFTKTVTVSKESEKTDENQINDKGDSIRKEAFQRVRIIYLILGITAGIWIIV
ncbi:hypothetical protein PMAC_000459 [Pneumocystis sp. 'macacae']|nr:hypothetical protein PMAC_000459 [Pneumocystis sp. 'macacae']